MMNGTSYIICFLFLLGFFSGEGQITDAKITFERKTNLYKKLKSNPNITNWVKEEDKIKSDFFELFITDTLTLFKPKESDLRENLWWTTSKNTVYQDLKHNTRYMIKPIWGEELHLTDSLVKRKWQITESSRKIAGYNCRKAIWRANDSTRIYVWFSYELAVSSGPESFNGLPGTILGVATEDGGVVYFATKIDLVKAATNELIKPKKKKKIYTVSELREDLERRYGKESWFKEMMLENFVIW